MTKKMTVQEIEAAMDGVLRAADAGVAHALLPSPKIQNHAAFLSVTPEGALHCVWFGGALEGKSDICVYRATLDEGSARWSAPEQLSNDPKRSEQNPVLFNGPDGNQYLLHTAQPGGNQDECVVRMREVGGVPRDLPLPKGTFIRASIHVREDGVWLLPLFMCVSRPGQRWTGSHDNAAVAISRDAGKTWQIVDVPDSRGCVHMTIVPLKDGRLAAFFRRRQSDFVHRSISKDNGETWGAPSATDVPNNNSSLSVVALSDGRLAMACNPINATMSPDRRASLYDELGSDDRPNASGGCEPIWGVPRAPMTICISRDGGETFPARRIVEDGTGKCLSNDSLDGKNREMSYPFLSKTPGGGLDLAYTYYRRAIKHVRLTANWLEGL